LAAGGLVVVLSSGCGSHGDGSPVPLTDVVWCDVEAIPCLVTKGSIGNTSCEVTGTAPVPATVPGGQRTCFDSASLTPGEACTALCADRGGVFGFYPKNPKGCSATVSKDAAFHSPLDADGAQPSACTGSPGDNGGLLGAGTNTVKVHGSGMATYLGASVAITIRSGTLNLAAPDTSCTPPQDTCGVALNQFDVSFDDFTVSSLSVQGLTFSSDGAFLTGSGTFVAPEPPADLDPLFLFFTDPFSEFDELATFGGTFQGLPIREEQAQNGSIDLKNGHVTYAFSFTDLINGQPLDISGVATTSEVVDRPPVITVAASHSIDATPACSAPVTLKATASSPVGLPVTLDYVVDDALVGSGASITKTLTVGTHAVIVVGIDTLGAMSRAKETVTVTGPATCP
jgi:hypothetical protein